MIDVPFEFYVDVFYPSKRSDLDGSFKIVLDCLQKAKVIKNDNNCSLIHARKFIDKENPRIEFTIKIA
jgi:Holliday junction resolvase RusA-like endonuclease